MSRAALYRLYRPQNFDEIEGQKHVAITLKNASKERNFAHAYLFTGTRGTGKTSLARITAKALICTKKLPDGNPCNVCSTCLETTAGHHVDVIEIDAASNSGVDDIRALVDRVQFLPAVAEKKVYIIDEVHMLSSSAFNALLKTLEEPPAHVHFILATTEQHKVLATIISRCQVFHFYPLAIDEMVARMLHIAGLEQFTLAPDAATLIAEHAHGGMRDALSILERLVAMQSSIDVALVRSVLGLQEKDVFSELVASLMGGNAAHILAAVDQARSSGIAPHAFLHGVKQALRTALLSDIHSDGMTDRAKELLRAADTLENSVPLLRYAEIPWLHIELALLKVAFPQAHPAAAQRATLPPVTSNPLPPKQAKAPSAPAAPVPKPAKQTPPKDSDDSSAVTRLQKEWQSFIFKVPNVQLRTALKSTKIQGLEDGTLVLLCQNPLQYAYFGEEEHRVTMQTALKTHYQIDSEIRVDLIEPQAKTDQDTPPAVHSEVAQAAPSVSEKPLTEEDAILKVADLFGGTLL